MYEIKDHSQENIYNDHKDLINDFMKFSVKNIGFDKPVKVSFVSDEGNAKNPLGKTAYYVPQDMKIVIYVSGRHVKDIMRSLSHELIHHLQNCNGELNPAHDTSPGYAQKNKHMRGLEMSAYKNGNVMNMRDFEDGIKND